MVLGVKMADIFTQKNPQTPIKNTKKIHRIRKNKISKIGFRSDLSWSKLGLVPKFHDPGTFVGFGKQITDKSTDRQDSCFISIDVFLPLVPLYTK